MYRVQLAREVRELQQHSVDDKKLEKIQLVVHILSKFIETSGTVEVVNRLHSILICTRPFDSPDTEREDLIMICKTATAYPSYTEVE